MRIELYVLNQGNLEIENLAGHVVGLTMLERKWEERKRNTMEMVGQGDQQRHRGYLLNVGVR